MKQMKSILQTIIVEHIRHVAGSAGKSCLRQNWVMLVPFEQRQEDW